MNLVIKYTITGVTNVSQLTNDTETLGITGLNFVGCNAATTMALTNAVATNNSDKASVLPAVNNFTSGTYVDKIIAITIPNTLDGTTINYLSVLLSNIGINSDIVGVEFIGLNRTETNNIAAFANHVIIRNSINFSVSKSRLIISIPNKSSILSFATTANDLVGADAAAIMALMNAARPALATSFQGAILNLRITYKN